MSENGWINSSLGFEWLQEIFEKYTSSQTASDYYLLILDGHSSHATASFNHFCIKRRIIPLYVFLFISSTSVIRYKLFYTAQAVLWPENER